MTDLTIIQFMISGALLLGLISIGFLVVHLRAAIERYNTHTVEYKQNLMGHLGRLENDGRRQDQECNISFHNVKESLKRRPTLNQLKSVERNMIKTFETQESATAARLSLARQFKEIRADIEKLHIKHQKISLESVIRRVENIHKVEFPALEQQMSSIQDNLIKKWKDDTHNAWFRNLTYFDDHIKKLYERIDELSVRISNSK